jgi:hypothetical protein
VATGFIGNANGPSRDKSEPCKITFSGADQKPVGETDAFPYLPVAPTRRHGMKFAWIGAAALAATAFATPAFAQRVVEDPGYCAQFYPNANCQNYGAGNPVGDPNGYYGNDWRNRSARMEPRWHHHHHRHHHG